MPVAGHWRPGVGIASAEEMVHHGHHDRDSVIASLEPGPPAPLLQPVPATVTAGPPGGRLGLEIITLTSSLTSRSHLATLQ